MAGYLPEIHTMETKLTGDNGVLPMDSDAGELATNVKGQSPEVRQAGAQLNTVDSHFELLESGDSQAVLVTDTGNSVVNTVDGTLPALTDFGQNATAAVDTTQDDVIPQIHTALGVVTNDTDAGLTLIAAAHTSLSADLNTLTTTLTTLDSRQDTAALKTAMATRLTALAHRTGKVAAHATSLADTLTRVQNTLKLLTGQDELVLDGAIE